MLERAGTRRGTGAHARGRAGHGDDPPAGARTARHADRSRSDLGTLRGRVAGTLRVSVCARRPVGRRARCERGSPVAAPRRRRGSRTMLVPTRAEFHALARRPASSCPSTVRCSRTTTRRSRRSARSTTARSGSCWRASRAARSGAATRSWEPPVERVHRARWQVPKLHRGWAGARHCPARRWTNSRSY